MLYIGLALLLAIIIGVFLWGLSQKDESLLLELLDAYRLGDGEEGDKLLEVARTRFTTTRARLRLLDTLFRSRAFPQAVRVVDDGLKTAPNHQGLLRYQARLAGAVLADDAPALLRDWVDKNPKDDRALLDLAEVYHRLRWHEHLLGALVPYVEQNPDSREARSLLGRGYFAAGEFELAQLHLAAAQQLRGQADRHQVAAYQFVGRAEYEVTLEERSQAEDDQRLLEQIADGTATGRVAVDHSAAPAPAEMPEAEDASDDDWLAHESDEDLAERSAAEVEDAQQEDAQREEDAEAEVGR